MLLPAALAVYDTVLGALFVLGFAGNLLVLVVICSLKAAHTVTNIYLINLAIADSLHLLSIPPFIHLSIIKSWVWGTIGCKLYFLMHFANSNVSIYIIMAMSFDRFKAVVSPFSSARYRTKKFAVILVVCMWLLSALIVSPIYLNAYVQTWIIPASGENATADHENNGTLEDRVWISRSCQHLPPGSVNHSEGLLKKLFTDPYYFSRYIFVTGCVLPGLLLCTFYFLILRKLWLMKRARSAGPQAQQRFEKVTILVVAVVTFYLACCLPHWIYVNIALELEDMTPSWVPVASHLTTLLAYVNSAGNPILYAFLNEPFRASMRAILAQHLPAGCLGGCGDGGGTGGGNGADGGEIADADAGGGSGRPTNSYEPLPLLPGGGGGGATFGASSCALGETTAMMETRVTETVID
ncbi:hypothetical protein BOX15_Mlig004520g3 [Macrostomum lignano]|uniref:G-protein coupled receptors family 1 profile domain-containing protein n=1 Tax=Macrostomum lignano TaxID=282301 RepID=A0A267FKL3_9PLAT|nr:hypothetical protein BOX15_Mlig004520g2 [Macrostomum lignano]PAA64924.1 hypothetical protein BOX15_Mlig004520g1 [Macrostomum lignano]PAA73744.1 hypothetical protein BOX15_Mlig004520g3 [Macrostomum lignano]